MFIRFSTQVPQKKTVLAGGVTGAGSTGLAIELLPV